MPTMLRLIWILMMTTLMYDHMILKKCYNILSLSATVTKFRHVAKMKDTDGTINFRSCDLEKAVHANFDTVRFRGSDSI